MTGRVKKPFYKKWWFILGGLYISMKAIQYFLKRNQNSNEPLLLRESTRSKEDVMQKLEISKPIHNEAVEEIAAVLVDEEVKEVKEVNINDNEEVEPLIKGSPSKIYHTPDSSHYEKTQNVIQWFYTVEEAEAAGFRAPKRP